LGKGLLGLNSSGVLKTRNKFKSEDVLGYLITVSRWEMATREGKREREGLTWSC
jgi:hypothetical protein